ncbi:MAG TPA: MBOAT family O-acyltransferase, partial [Bacteroidia bacterium]
MMFNSLSFLGFFIIVYSSYLLFRKNFKIQNLILLIASYYFYSCWDWRFLFLLVFSTFLDYFTGAKIFDAKTQKGKKRWLVTSIGINLGFLAFFKYYNFFIDSFADLTGRLGFHVSLPVLSIVLPVGISFYTFHGLSYVLDLYNNKITPERNFVNYSLFVSFFPLLVAGPIERATHLLPQISKPRSINADQVNAGLFLIVWGFFKKVVIADNLARISDQVFSHPQWDFSGIDLWLGVFAFMFQIYCDFSGYSDIGRGISKLMGFELLMNFKLPYFSKDPSEFWQRWHISLSGWLRDYLYIPLGGNKNGKLKTYRNLMITMILGGLWHGAAWTFVLWGFYHGALLVIYRVAEERAIISVNRYRIINVAIMFLFTL